MLYQVRAVLLMRSRAVPYSQRLNVTDWPGLDVNKQSVEERAGNRNPLSLIRLRDTPTTRFSVFRQPYRPALGGKKFAWIQGSGNQL
jgi:hypothetical protein